MRVITLHSYYKRETTSNGKNWSCVVRDFSPCVNVTNPCDVRIQSGAYPSKRHLNCASTTNKMKVRAGVKTGRNEY